MRTDQKATQGSAKQGHPDVGGESDQNHTEHCTKTSQQQDWFSAYAVRQAAPVHAGHGLSQRKGRDEKACVEAGIVLVADMESFDKWESVWEDGSESNRLGQSNDG